MLSLAGQHLFARAVLQVIAMGGGGLQCPLCQGHMFSDLFSYSSALRSLVSRHLACPVMGCGTTVLGILGLVEHLTTHINGELAK